jgi:hypothetical protein
LREAAEKFSGKPTLHVEIGNYMQGTGNDRTVKNTWLWQGMEKLAIQVLNVAEDDVAELKALNIDIRKDSRFISANLLSASAGTPLLRPYVVKSIALKGTEKKYRLGFLGLAAREGFLKTEDAGYTWADPLASAKKWLPELREKCDFLIVLACMPTRDAVQLAVDNSNIDIVLTGFKHQYAAPPARINQSTLVYAEDEGKILGELRFVSVRSRADVQPINHILTRNVKDEPGMAAFIKQARAAISEAQLALANGAGTPAVQLPAELSPFATAAACSACHAAAHQVWEKSQHAHAIETLRKERKEFDSSCVVCHVTGAGKVGGFINLKETGQLANVQCEACHGPGKDHVARPTEAKMAQLTSDSCLQCHTQSNSPEFEFSSYWPKVKH